MHLCCIMLEAKTKKLVLLSLVCGSEIIAREFSLNSYFLALLLEINWFLKVNKICGLSFCFVSCFLCGAKVFEFEEVSLVYFCFCFHYSGRWIKKDVAVIYVRECSMFSSFIVSGLTFRSLIHFELIFVYGVEEWSIFRWPYNPTLIQEDTYTPMFTVALLIIVKTRRQPTSPLTEEWIKEMWYNMHIYIMEYRSAIKKNETMPFAAT